MYRLTSLFMVALISLIACSADNKNTEQQGVIPQHQLQALEKAKATENLLQDADTERRQQLDGE